MVMHNQILEKIINENSQLHKLYRKDNSLFISFLFLFYSINKDKDNENITYSNFKKKISFKLNSNYAYKVSYYNLEFAGYLSDTFNESYKYLFNYDLTEIKDLIKYMVLSLLFKTNGLESSYEKIEKVFFSENLGDFLALSNAPKIYLFSENTKVNSITFNFYSDLYNTLSSIYFDIFDIQYHIFDIKSLLNENILFDNIFYCLPYTRQDRLLDIQELYSEAKGSIELESVKDLHNHLKNNGHLCMLLPTGILNNIRDFKAKKYFVDNGYVNLVLELPKLPLASFMLSGIFFSRENKNILMCNASKYTTGSKKDISINVDKIIRAITGEIEDALIEMDTNYIKENRYDLTPHRYTEKKHYDFINPTKLKDVTLSMFRGYQISSDMIESYSSDLPTKIKLLTLSDIENGEIKKDTLLSLKEIDKGMKHYILENEDLIISCKGKSFKTCVVEIPRGETYISTGSIIVIRLNKELINPTYLKIFFDSKIGNSALKNIQTGQSVLSLNPTKLLNVDIPLTDIMKQNQIASSYMYKLSNIKEVKEVMDSMQKDMDKKFDDDFLDLLQ